MAESHRLPVILAADAVWDALMGIAFFLVPWPAFAHGLGLPAARPWPLFVVVGAGCLAFAVVLAQAARGRNPVAVARLAAVTNAAGLIAAIIAAVLLGTPPGLVVLVAGVVCGLFAVLERRAASNTTKAGRGLRIG